MNDMAAMCMEIAATHGRKGTLPIKHIPGPEGVRGRNSNNDLIKQVRRRRRRTSMPEWAHSRWLAACPILKGWGPAGEALVPYALVCLGVGYGRG